LPRADLGGASAYQKNLDAFLAQWKARRPHGIRRPTAARQGIIQYHRLFDYFARRTGMKIRRRAGAEARHSSDQPAMEELIEANAAGTVLHGS